MSIPCAFQWAQWLYLGRHEQADLLLAVVPPCTASQVAPAMPPWTDQNATKHLQALFACKIKQKQRVACHVMWQERTQRLQFYFTLAQLLPTIRHLIKTTVVFHVITSSTWATVITWVKWKVSSSFLKLHCRRLRWKFDYHSVILTGDSIIDNVDTVILSYFAWNWVIYLCVEVKFLAQHVSIGSISNTYVQIYKWSFINHMTLLVLFSRSTS